MFYHDFYTWKIVIYWFLGSRYCCLEVKGLVAGILRYTILIESLKATHLDFIVKVDPEFVTLYDPN